MNCSKCSIPIPDDKSFCPNCGHFNKPNNLKKTSTLKPDPNNTSIPLALIGFILWGTFTILIMGGCYYTLFQYPLVPALHSNWLYIHIPLGLISYSGILSALIITAIAFFNNLAVPKIVLKFQTATTILFFLCIITGAIWASQAWGTYWSWDPRQTWSLILFLIMLPISVCMLLMTLDVRISLVLLGIEVLISIIVFYMGTKGLHSYLDQSWRLN